MAMDISQQLELARLKSVLSSARLGIWDWNPITNNVIFNNEWKRMVGYELNELPNELSSWERLIHPDDKEHTYDTLNQHMEGHNDYYESRHRLKHKDGHYIWILDTGKIVDRNKDGQPCRVTGIHQDITETIHLQEELRKEKELAERAAQIKSQFLANMSHEIRTPMNGIRGACQLLLQNECSEENRELIEIIDKSSEHLVCVINDILDLSKIESGKMTLNYENTNVNDIINTIKTLAELLTKTKSLKLNINIRSKSNIWMRTDPTRLQQILWNLINNAIKFTSVGYIKLLVMIIDEETKIVFIVEDTGIGMSEEQCKKIFNEFVQADESTTRKFGGTGLGLSISKHLSEQMNGTLTCQSELGEGSIFKVSLPFTKILPNASELLTPDTKKRTLQRQYNHTIILAEDNYINVQIAVKMLDKIGIHTIVVSDGQQLIDKIVKEKTEHDYIITDWHMPNKSGLDATMELRTKYKYKKKIICMTASVTSDEVNQCLLVGCDDVVTKPFRMSDLIGCIDKFCK